MKTITGNTRFKHAGQSIIGLLLCHQALALDLGRQGTTWPIREPDMRLRMVYEASKHSWDKEQQKLREEAQTYASTIQGWDIPPAQRSHSYFVDPTYTLEEDVRKSPDRNGEGGGEVLLVKGTTVNPLEYERPREWLFVFDGTLQGQINQAKQLIALQADLPPIRLIALAGDLAALTETLGQTVYRADEWLFTRAGVKESPSLVGVGDSAPLKLKVSVFRPTAPVSEFFEAVK